MLAGKLSHLRGTGDLLVLALPRGGVAVGYEVARALQAPLDVFMVRKLGMPGYEEFAVGAIASGGVQVMNPLPGVHVPQRQFAEVLAREQAELKRREMLYRPSRPALAIAGRIVIVTDDGLATGATMLVAVEAIRRQWPARLVVAVPVGAPESCERLREHADEVVCAAMPQPFRAVGLWYADFPQSTDAEVQDLLGAAWREHAPVAH